MRIHSSDRSRSAGGAFSYTSRAVLTMRKMVAEARTNIYLEEARLKRRASILRNETVRIYTRITPRQQYNPLAKEEAIQVDDSHGD